MSQENQNNPPATDPNNTGATGQGGSPGATQQGSAGGATIEAMPGLAAAQAEREKQTAGGAAAPPPPPASGLSPEQISALVRSAVGEVAQRSAPAEPHEVTMAKFEKAFNVYKFDPDKLARLGYNEDQIASVAPVYEDMRDGLVRQAVTMAAYQMGLLKEELMKQFQPALDSARQQMETQLKAEFLDKHKDLVGYEPLLEEIKNRMVAQNKQFASKEVLFETISTEARAIIDKVLKRGTAGGGAPAGGGGNGNGNGQQQQSHRMSTVSTGGQGGAGGSPAGTGDKPGWLKALE